MQHITPKNLLILNGLIPDGSGQILVTITRTEQPPILISMEL